MMWPGSICPSQTGSLANLHTCINTPNNTSHDHNNKLNARWSYSCTVFEMATERMLMDFHPSSKKPQVRNPTIATFSNAWTACHHALRREKGELDGHELGQAAQQQLFRLRDAFLRRIVWGCCHPEPTERTRRLDEEMNKWSATWATDMLSSGQLNAIV